RRLGPLGVLARPEQRRPRARARARTDRPHRAGRIGVAPALEGLPRARSAALRLRHVRPARRARAPALRARRRAAALALVRRRDPRRGGPCGPCFHDGVRAFLSDHPTLRGFLIIGLIAVIIVVLSLQATLAALFLIANIAFFIAIAFFIFLVWRE